jgi:hypothetical protein
MTAVESTDAKLGAAPENFERKLWSPPRVIISQTAVTNKIPTTTELPAYSFGLS